MRSLAMILDASVTCLSVGILSISLALLRWMNTKATLWTPVSSSPGNGVPCTKLKKCLFPCVPMLCPLGYQLCCFARWVLVQITPASCANTPSLEFYSESVGCLRGNYLNPKKWIYWFSLTLRNIYSHLNQTTLLHSLFLGIHFLQRDFSLLWQHSLLSLKMPRTFFFFYVSFFFLISWRLITLQYCSGFCHTLKWISHGFTCAPHPDRTWCTGMPRTF